MPVVTRAAMSANVYQQKSPKNTMRYVWKYLKPIKGFIFTIGVHSINILKLIALVVNIFYHFNEVLCKKR